MIKNSQVNNDEINLVQLVQTVWEGKWKIAVAIVISLIIIMSYQFNKKKDFTATTEIKPVSTSEINKYIVLNNIIKVIETDLNNIIEIETETEAEKTKIKTETKSKTITETDNEIET